MKTQSCFHACPVRHCKWEFQHPVQETMDPSLCPFWRRCPTCAFFQASNINHARRNWDAKQKATVTETDKATEVQSGGEYRREIDLEKIRQASLPQLGSVGEPCEMAFAAWDDTVEEMSFLP
jgi:hypothetical protein